MSYKFLDTHAHLNLAQFADDYTAVYEQCAAEGVGMINVGTHKSTSEKSVALAEQFGNAWSIVGLHPINVAVAGSDAADETLEKDFDYDFYKNLAEKEQVVGIGECGFDYWHYSDETYEEQREVLRAQIALANEVGKPLMLHLRNAKDGVGRNAYDDALEILRSEAKVHGNAHFFAGTVEQAQQFFDLGYTVSFTGVITFAKEYEELVQAAPLDMIHGETDCPYVAPVPHRGKRCEPWMVEEVYKKIAEMKEEDEEQVREQLLQNAVRHYGLELSA